MNAKPIVSSISFALAIFAGHLCAGSVYAQRTVGTRDLSTSERDLRAVESDANRSKRDSRTIMAEINEDFARLKAINEEMKKSSAATDPLNYKMLTDDALEIKRRGTRLKGNLAALPKPDKQEKQKPAVPVNESEMRALLGTETTVLTAFLGNPVFSDMGTLDTQLAVKARRDLDSVVELSDLIKSGADKLSKTSKP